MLGFGVWRFRLFTGLFTTLSTGLYRFIYGLFITNATALFTTYWLYQLFYDCFRGLIYGC